MTWSYQYVQKLPNSSFAWIDAQGNRHLPYKDASGKIDHDHTANALARLNQVQGMSSTEREAVRAKLEKALKESNGQQADADGDNDNDAPMMMDRTFRVSPIKLDASGNLPTRVLLFITGDWPDSVKGDFSVSLDDLKQMKANFDAGVGFPTEDASTGLAIDFKHEYLDEAAGWIKGLQLEVDPSNGQGRLYADPVEWSDAGVQAIQGGRFKCISPSGYFGRKAGRLSMWANPTNLKEKVANVLDGAGLTNFPFLRGMAPIRAHATAEDLELDYDSVIFVSNGQQQKEKRMDIDQLRLKEADQLTAEEKAFLEAPRKLDLSAEELNRLGLTAEASTVSDEDKALLAAIKSGDKMVVDKGASMVDAERLSALEKTAEQYRTEKAESIVELHIKRGAIKQDAAPFWTKQLLSATSDEQRKEMEDALSGLPSNENLVKELGTSEDVAAGSTARDQLAAIASKKVADAAKEGKELLYADALKQAARENADLQKQDLIETKLKAGV